MKPIEAVIFDMDGLMFDTERLYFDVWNEIMAEFGYIFDLEMYKATVGLRKDAARQWFFNTYGAGFEFEVLMKRASAESALREIPIKPRLFELLQYLKDAGVKLAVATSTGQNSAEKTLKSAGAYKYFDAFIFGNSVKNGKPDPEIYLTAAKILNVEPQKCIALEDSINGIRSAFAAKMIAIMVPDLITPTPEMKKLAAYICVDLNEARSVIENIIGRSNFK
jgi:HAD superfamily hydrolase (TIGR01509 family)